MKCFDLKFEISNLKFEISFAFSVTPTPTRNARIPTATNKFQAIYETTPSQFKINFEDFPRRFCARRNSRHTRVKAIRRIIFTPGRTTRQYNRNFRRAPGLVANTRVSVLRIEPPSTHSSAAKFITIFANPGSAKATNSRGVSPRNCTADRQGCVTVPITTSRSVFSSKISQPISNMESKSERADFK